MLDDADVEPPFEGVDVDEDDFSAFKSVASFFSAAASAERPETMRGTRVIRLGDATKRSLSDVISPALATKLAHFCPPPERSHYDRVR